MNSIQRLILLLSLPFLLYAQRTVQICAIRAEFPADDNPLTTGRGLMLDDSVTTTPYAIDPAPHNRTYFYDQIRAADHYFNTVSGGLVRIDGDVFPKQQNLVYQLPEKMSFYNPNTTEQEINSGLARLFADALGLADADPDIRFADYDLIVVFHAGVGKDIEFDFDETTQDIPSLFLTENFLQGIYGSAFSGFLVDQNMLINQGIILPEMLNQEGLQIALTGLFVSNIASYLGAPDLFNPLSGRTVVGRFGLMDAGLLNANGLIPAPPGAFTREWLGWDVPLEIKSDSAQIGLENYFSAANSGHSKLIKIPLNENEYYLLEHRGLPGQNLDSLYAAAITDKLPGYLEVLAEHFPEKIHISDSSGVLLGVENYDLGLPGSGVLIWHIDRQAISAGLELNHINGDDARRGVDLEEADGSQDLGKYYTLLDAGYQTELGYFADFWYDGNPAYLYRNEFGPQTRPSTAANVNRAYSGITLKNFTTKKSPLIYFNFERSGLDQGYPISVTMPGSGKQNIKYFSPAPDSGWLVLNDHGSRLVFVEAGVGAARQISWPAQLVTTDSISTVLIDPDNPALLYIVLNQSVQALQVSEALSGLQFTEQFVINHTVKPGLVAAAKNRLAFITADLQLEVWSDSGTQLSSEPVSAEARSLLIDPDGYVLTSGFELINLTAFYANGEMLSAGFDPLLQQIRIMDADKTTGIVNTDPAFSGEFAVGDVDGNGLPDLVFASGNQVFACHLNGSLLSGFPKSFNLEKNDTFLTTPLLWDENQDSRSEIFIASENGVLFRIGDEEQSIFPLTCSAPIGGAPALFYNSGRSLMLLLLLSADGNLYSWKIGSGLPQPGDWLSSDLTAGNNRFRPLSSNPVALSGGLMPVKSVFNYPNPNQGDFTTIRYYLNETARVRIRIFDLAGDPVTEFDGPGAAHQANEKIWNVSAVSSGIYLAHIEAKTTSKTVSTLIKIMVVH